MNKPIRILYIDDSPFDRELVQDALEKENAGFELVITASHASFEAALAQGGFDIVLSDFNILGFDGLQVLEVVHAQDVNLPVIIVTGTGSEEIAVEALKRGASEYVIKTPAHIQRLPQTIHAVMGKKRLAEERKQAEETLRASEKMLHEAQIIAGLGSYSLDISTGLWTSSDVLDNIFSAHPTSHWLNLLEGRMPIAPVNRLDAALDNPFVHATGMVQTIDHPDLPDMRVLANPIRIDGQRLPTQAAPLLGADTDAILREIGYDADAIDRLRSAAVV